MAGYQILDLRSIAEGHPAWIAVRRNNDGSVALLQFEVSEIISVAHDLDQNFVGSQSRLHLVDCYVEGAPRATESADVACEIRFDLFDLCCKRRLVRIAFRARFVTFGGWGFEGGAHQLLASTLKFAPRLGVSRSGERDCAILKHRIEHDSFQAQNSLCQPSRIGKRGN